jgi:hypothetical protein
MLDWGAALLRFRPSTSPTSRARGRWDQALCVVGHSTMHGSTRVSMRSLASTLIATCAACILATGCADPSSATRKHAVDYTSPCLFGWSAAVLEAQAQAVERKLHAALCELSVCDMCEAPPRVAFDVDMLCPPDLRQRFLSQESVGTLLQDLVWPVAPPRLTCVVGAMDLEHVWDISPTLTVPSVLQDLAECELSTREQHESPSALPSGCDAARRPDELLQCKEFVRVPPNSCPAGTRSVEADDPFCQAALEPGCQHETASLCEIVDPRIVVSWSSKHTCASANADSPEAALWIHPGVRPERDAMLRTLAAAHLECIVEEQAVSVRSECPDVSGLDAGVADDAGTGEDAGVDCPQPQLSDPQSAALVAVREVHALAARTLALQRALDYQRGPAFMGLLQAVHDVEPYLSGTNDLGCKQKPDAISATVQQASEALDRASSSLSRVRLVLGDLWWVRAP